MFRSLWNILVSRNIAIILLSVVTIMLAAGAFLPNPALLPEDYRERLREESPLIYWLGERYNSERMAQGYLFGFIGVFLIISTTACSIDRLIKWRRTRSTFRGIPPQIDTKEGISVELGYQDRDKVAIHIRDWFKRHRMRVFQREGLIVGYRGVFGFWGSVFFHGILITALFGLVIYYLGGYRALFNITEGQTIRLSREAFFYIEKEPIWGLRPPDAIVSLDSVYTIYAHNDPWSAIDHIVKLNVKELDSGRMRQEVLKINKPIEIGGKEFLLESGGYSPEIVVTRNGRRIFQSFVALRNRGGREDHFQVDGLRVDVRFFPDFYMKDGAPATMSPQVKNPFFEVTVSGRSLTERGIIPLGGVMEAGDYRIHIPELRRWVMIKMVGEPGVGFFFVVSVFGVLAELVRFLDPDERVYVRFKEDGCEIFTHSKYFSGLLKERILGLVEDLRRARV
jgi:cytochrome c biogenesis protein